MTHSSDDRDLKNKSSKIVREVHEREALERLDNLAEQIARSWRSPKGAVDLIEEQRR